ncbi:DUF4037 domain-containing protein [Ihubacter sp. mB4P-1]|uniref:DUF4037 domain-containing protein n=1 Tax=Ihubacter sp. mB4P-1 TaxID=3242370 RepID=UPI00137AFD41
MKGLTLSRNYYEAYGQVMIESVAPELSVRAAVGLAGEGSQCFGFDDDISQDHDFAPGFCIWLSDEDFANYGAALQQAYDQLPSLFQGFSRDNIIAKDRLGVMKISSFYARFTGNPDGSPASNLDWLLTPENQLAAATNGEVFRDDAKIFTSIRQHLLQFYPEDVLRKKLAARAAVMSQAGQYNLLRVIRRGDAVAALLSLSRFTESTLSMIYLLNRQYMPFYKWAYHGLSNLPLLAADITALLSESAECLADMINERRLEKARQKAFDLTEQICHLTACELNRQNFSFVNSDFLQDHLSSIMDGIKDPQLRRMPPMFDCNN